MNNTFEKKFRTAFDAVPVPVQLLEKQAAGRERWADPAYRAKWGKVSDLLIKKWCEYFLAFDHGDGAHVMRAGTK